MQPDEPTAPEAPGAGDEATGGSALFNEFLVRNGITLQGAADALGVSDVTVLDWRRGRKRPRPHQRKKIDTWTNGEVPEGCWDTPSERQELKSVTPFRSGGGGGASC